MSCNKRMYDEYCKYKHIPKFDINKILNLPEFAELLNVYCKKCNFTWKVTRYELYKNKGVMICKCGNHIGFIKEKDGCIHQDDKYKKIENIISHQRVVMYYWLKNIKII